MLKKVKTEKLPFFAETAMSTHPKLYKHGTMNTEQYQTTTSFPPDPSALTP